MFNHRKSIEKQLQAARPRLAVASPLAFWIVMIFGVFNILLGLSFVFALDQGRFTASLLIVNNIFSYDRWGMIFIVLGVVKLFSLYTNNWNLSRNSLFIGVAIKAGWAIALIIRIFVSPGTLFVMLVWVTLAAVQICTFIFFMPPSIGSYKQRKQDRISE